MTLSDREGEKFDLLVTLIGWHSLSYLVMTINKLRQMIIFSHCGERLETGSDWSSTEIEGNKQENIYQGGREGGREVLDSSKSAPIIVTIRFASVLIK